MTLFKNKFCSVENTKKAQPFGVVHTILKLMLNIISKGYHIPLNNNPYQTFEIIPLANNHRLHSHQISEVSIFAL